MRIAILFVISVLLLGCGSSEEAPPVAKETASSSQMAFPQDAGGGAVPASSDGDASQKR